MSRSLVSMLALVASLLGATSLSGCGRAITPAELDKNGTHVFHGHQKPETVHASAIALKTLGYEVVVEDVANGRVKTSPKLVTVHAVGGNGSATAIADSIQWSLEIVGTSSDSVVKAHPHAFRNGLAMDDSQLQAGAVNKAFLDLFKEIDENLGSGPIATPTPATAPKSKAQAKKPAKVF